MRYAFAFLLTVCFSIASSQVYLEDFTGQDGFGIAGACLDLPGSCDVANIPSPTGWTLVGDASGLLDSNDIFKVVNGELRATDTDGELCFQSSWIHIGSCDSAIAGLTIREVGDLESTDYADVYITADTLTELIVDPMGSGDSTHTLVGDFPDDADWQSVDISFGGIIGDSVLISVCIRNNAGTESIIIDDIDVDCQLNAIAPEVYISELDCDQPGIDTAEFVELAGPPGQSLDGFLLVMYNGSDDASYAAYSLEGEVIGPSSTFTICFDDNTNEYCDLNVSGQIQNGADGIGLYYNRDISDFPTNTPIDSVGLVDGLRYGTGEPIDSGLVVLDMDDDCTGDECQVNEEPAEYSIQRGSWYVGPPTPGALNADPLAVQWLSFDAFYDLGVVNLLWKTSTEHHNDYFSVEYARDRGAFHEIGQLPGQHSSRSVRTYRFQHRATASGSHHYYRIRSVDENGSSDFSEIKAIRKVDRSPVRIWPSLVRGSVHIAWPGEGSANVAVYSPGGGILLRRQVHDSHGSGIDLSHFSPGVYIVEVRTGTERIVDKIAVSR